MILRIPQLHRHVWWLVLSLVLVSGKRKKRPGKDYYETLGILDDKADKDAIQKAYKARALEYHPDKCKEKKEVCQTKFIELSAAYEVLSDPEKRKTYDEYGEEGMQEGFEDDHGGEHAKQMFRDFTGREPDGNVRIVERDGQMMFVEEGEPGPKENLYDDTSITELNSDVWKSAIEDRDEPWVVEFYKPNDDDSVEAKPEYIAFADKFKEFLKVGAVNCRQQRDICAEVVDESENPFKEKKPGAKPYPAVRWFHAEKEKDPEEFQDAMTSKDLGKWASDLMPDHSTVVQDKFALRKWLDNVTGPAVLLFTDKSGPPPMWKALGREFKGRANLGVVPRCDKTGVFKTPLQRKFDVHIPQVIRLDPIDEHGKIAEKFDSQMKKDVLSLWLIKTIALSRKAGPAATFKEWNADRLAAGDCASTDGQFCFLWLKAGADPVAEEATRKISQKYRTDPIKMMWVNVEMNPSVLEAFGLENSDRSDFFVAYRPKRAKFKVHEGGFQFAELDAFVDGVMNGGSPLPNKVTTTKLEL